jgi:hypothetical protein
VERVALLPVLLVAQGRSRGVVPMLPRRPSPYLGDPDAPAT